MLVRPRLADHKVIGFYLGTVLVGISCALCVPLLTALFCREYVPLMDYALSALITLSLGLLLRRICFTKKEIDWLHGLAIAALSWLIAALAGGLPLYLGGVCGSFFDAVFEAMSALTTTGFSLAPDIDHLAIAHNMWRHLLMFLGGQGIVVIALSLLFRGGAGSFKLYTGEARDERILPNILHTARFIWLVSGTLLVAGTAILTLILRADGLSWLQSFLHGLWLFMAGFDTGGFTPQSQSILYYHSWRLQLALLFIVILGMINFHLHYVVWTGNRREIWRNIELKGLLATIGVTFCGLAIALLPAYSDGIALFNKGFFTLISGHSTTGYMTIYPEQFLTEWSQPALLILIAAMGIGGSVCSTTGAIKILRLGILAKSLWQDIRRLLLPDAAVVSQRYHHLCTAFLQDKVVRAAAMITLLYIASYLLGAFAGVCYGYPLLSALFESVSAASNTGLSCGILNPALPLGLKLIYFLQIWLGRLEFIAIFGLLSYLWACWKGKL